MRHTMDTDGVNSGLSQATECHYIVSDNKLGT